MDCKKMRSMFSEIYDAIQEEYPLDGAVINHLNSCPACVAEFDAYSNVINEVRGLPEPELPQDFHHMLVEYVKRNRRQKQATLAWVTPIVSAAASIIFAVIWVVGAAVMAPEIENGGFGEGIEIEAFGGEIGIMPTDIDIQIYDDLPTGRMFPGFEDEDVPVFYDEPTEGFNLNTVWLLLAFLFAMVTICTLYYGWKLKRKNSHQTR